MVNIGPGGSEDPVSPQAIELGGRLDALHAVGARPSPVTGTCPHCGFKVGHPDNGGWKHLPAPGEFTRVRTYLNRAYER
jgi:hypothetical protein